MINIKELAREAGLLVHNPDGIPTKLEKFAELIILQCSNIALNNVMNISSYSDAAFVARQIEEHFGID